MHDLDKNTTLLDLKNMVQEFVIERDWQQFNSPKNLAMNLSVEVNELLEKFLWMKDEASFDAVNKNRQEIEDEISDILLSILFFYNAADIEIVPTFLKKFEKIKLRYSIEKSKGVHTEHFGKKLKV